MFEPGDLLLLKVDIGNFDSGSIVVVTEDCKGSSSHCHIQQNNISGRLLFEQYCYVEKIYEI